MRQHAAAGPIRCEVPTMPTEAGVPGSIRGKPRPAPGIGAKGAFRRGAAVPQLDRLLEQWLTRAILSVGKGRSPWWLSAGSKAMYRRARMDAGPNQEVRRCVG